MIVDDILGDNSNSFDIYQNCVNDWNCDWNRGVRLTLTARNLMNKCNGSVKQCLNALRLSMMPEDDLVWDAQSSLLQLNPRFLSLNIGCLSFCSPFALKQVNRLLFNLLFYSSSSFVESKSQYSFVHSGVFDKDELNGQCFLALSCDSIVFTVWEYILITL